MSRGIELFVDYSGRVNEFVITINELLNIHLKRFEKAENEVYSYEAFGFGTSVYEAIDFVDDKSLKFTDYTMVIAFDTYTWTERFSYTWEDLYDYISRFVFCCVAEKLKLKCMLVDDMQSLIDIHPYTMILESESPHKLPGSGPHRLFVNYTGTLSEFIETLGKKLSIHLTKGDDPAKEHYHHESFGVKIEIYTPVASEFPETMPGNGYSITVSFSTTMGTERFTQMWGNLHNYLSRFVLCYMAERLNLRCVLFDETNAIIDKHP